MATGYEYTEEKRIVEYDKDGSVKPVRIEKTVKHVQPSVAAQCFWLKNRQRGKWSDRPEYITANIESEKEQTKFYLPEKESIE